MLLRITVSQVSAPFLGPVRSASNSGFRAITTSAVAVLQASIMPTRAHPITQSSRPAERNSIAASISRPIVSLAKYLTTLRVVSD